LELTLSEPMRAGSLAKARITLAGQEIAPEDVQLSQDGRRLLLAAAPSAGQQMTLRVEGLEDRSGNVMEPLEVRFTLADSAQYQVAYDAASPQVLAILDEGQGVSVLFDEPVVPAAGMELESAITVTRAGAPVAGSVTRISPWQLAWRPSESSAWILGGEYRVSIAGLVELAPEQKPVSSSLLPASFTHLASPGEKILVASPPPETPPRASSAFGNTTLFQGRLWVPELGLYYYRARWYDPQLGDFLERDPNGYEDSPSLYCFLGRNPVNVRDPWGRKDDWGTWLPPEEKKELWEKGAGSAPLGPVLRAALIDLGHALETRNRTRIVDALVGEKARGDRAAGLDLLQGTIAWPFMGVSAGFQVEVFFQKEQFTVALFGVETARRLIHKHEVVDANRWGERALDPYVPTGVFGLAASLTLVGVNAALADAPEYNTPEKWGSWSRSVSGGPIWRFPFSLTFFWNDYFVGGSLGFGPGFGGWYSTSFGHVLAQWTTKDLEPVRGLLTVLVAALGVP
jgi:RHS repeat-associated protein